MNLPIAMTEEYWANSHFSVAKYYGRIQFNNNLYIIVDKRGHTIFECSVESEKLGKEKAIDPGEPADLVLDTLQMAYRKLGRERIIELIKDGKTEVEIKALAKKVGKE